MFQIRITKNNGIIAKLYYKKLLTASRITKQLKDKGYDAKIYCKGI